MDEQVNRRGRSNYRGGGQGRSGGLSVSNPLGMVVSLGFPRCLSGSTLVGTVSFLAAVEAESFSDASCTISRGEFSETDCVYVHSIGVIGG